VISNVRWTSGSRTASWENDSVFVEKAWDFIPRTVTGWNRPPSVIVVEPIVEGGRLDNAVVLNPDGTERLRLIPPRVAGEPIWNLGFYAVYESNDHLVAVFTTRVGDWWGQPDLTTGQLASLAEWR
jgi:hypothetical protein